MTKYLDSTETAKLARQILKEAYPGVKFSVRVSKYSGGASIYVRWEDGPASKEVDDLLGPLNGTYFDGMIDYAGTRYALLDGEKVHFGGSLSTTRENSSAAISAAVAKVSAEANSDVRALITVEAYNKGQLWNVQPFGGYCNETSAAAEISRAMYGISHAQALPSPTAARITFAGDDGYGAGTVGDLALPEAERTTSAGYARPEPKQEPEILPPGVVRLSDFFKGATLH